jgi:hypothetical protein
VGCGNCILPRGNVLATFARFLTHSVTVTLLSYLCILRSEPHVALQGFPMAAGLFYE